MGTRILTADSRKSRTHGKVSDAPMRKVYTPDTAAVSVEEVLRLLEGRWKLVILFHLFGGKVQRYSDLERLIPGISQSEITN